MLGPVAGVLHVVSAVTDPEESSPPLRSRSRSPQMRSTSVLAGSDIPPRSSLHPDALLRVIRIGPYSPPSPIDRFVLELARARVDAILVSGAVLRAEPELVYAPNTHWIGAGKEPPVLLVLTRGNLSRRHPVWDSEVRPVVFCARALDLPPHVEQALHPTPSPESAIRFLRNDRDCRGVSIEAGPTVARALYDGDAVDEVMLSLFEGPLDPPRPRRPPWCRWHRSRTASLIEQRH